MPSTSVTAIVAAVLLGLGVAIIVPAPSEQTEEAVEE